MRDLAGTYRARGENSKTGGAVVGEMRLTQAGSMLVGRYHFWEERDTEPVSFSLPWHDCDVAGEVLKDDLVPRDKMPNYHDPIPGGWDVSLCIGGQNLHGVLMKGGSIALSVNGEHFDYCEVFHRHPSTIEVCAPFEYLIDQLGELGSANDAADRGYSDVADGMRNKVFERIRELIDMHPEVCAALPDLAAQVTDGSLAYFGWATQIERAQGYIDALKADES
jgi:hypothetical protein